MNNLRDEHGYQIQSRELRKLLGLPKKLPTTSILPRLIGDTWVYVISQEIARLRNPRAIRPHRVFAVCNTCMTHVPAGRLHQHRKGHKNG